VLWNGARGVWVGASGGEGVVVEVVEAEHVVELVEAVEPGNVNVVEVVELAGGVDSVQLVDLADVLAMVDLVVYGCKEERISGASLVVCGRIKARNQEASFARGDVAMVLRCADVVGRIDIGYWMCGLRGRFGE
jgi:hypothetical protein